MNVKINGKQYRFEESMNLNQVLAFLRIVQTTGIAVAVNSSVVPKSLLNEVSVKDGDEIEVIRAVQGG